MKRPFGLALEVPRKGSRMSSVYDPTVDAFVLAEHTRSGRIIVHERLDALAMLDIDLVKAFCLHAGAAWTTGADLAGSQNPNTGRESVR